MIIAKKLQDSSQCMLLIDVYNHAANDSVMTFLAQHNKVEMTNFKGVNGGIR